MSEHTEQVALIEWANMRAGHIPELRWLFAVPNGGFRAKVTARKLAAEGVKRGVPDLILPVPQGKYHALFIEMKFGHNKPMPEQKVWHKALSLLGYAVAVCYSTEYAIDVIEQYLELPLNQRTKHMEHA